MLLFAMFTVSCGAQERRALPAGTGVASFYTESRQIIVAASVYGDPDKSSAGTWIPQNLNLSDEGVASWKSVLTHKLALARGLTSKDFQVLDEGVEQRINYFKEADFPAAYISGEAAWFFNPTPDGTWGIGPNKDEYIGPAAMYLIGYIPPRLNLGECHTFQVIVKGRYVHLNRDQYCNRSLSRNVGRAFSEGLNAQMRSIAASPSVRGSIKVSAQAFQFWSSGVLSLASSSEQNNNVHESPSAEFTYRIEVRDAKAPATIHITMNVGPPKQTWWNCPNSHAIHVLGMAYKQTGQVADEFAVTYSCTTSTVDRGFNHQFVPSRFDTEIALPQGEYELHLVVSDGKDFGSTRLPLHVEPFRTDRLMMSDLVFGSVLRDASWVLRDAVWTSPAPVVPKPLVSNNVEYFPATDTRFQRRKYIPVYFEIYEPELKGQTGVGFRLKVTELKSHSIVETMGPVSAANWLVRDETVIPIGMKLPTEGLRKGAYRLEVQASDSAGRQSEWRQATFTVE